MLPVLYPWHAKAALWNHRGKFVVVTSLRFVHESKGRSGQHDVLITAILRYATPEQFQQPQPQYILSQRVCRGSS